jgi:uncharacterized membrane protein YdjX (TVP38/TMEM64 family)
VKNKKLILRFAALVAFLVIAWFAVKYFGISQILHPAMIKEKVLAFGMFAPLVYMVFYSAAAVLFIPGAPLTIAGGALFGPVFGTLYTVIGATVGAALAFLLARFFGRGFVGALEGENWKKLGEYDKKIEENGLGIVLFLRFAPLFPFNGLNFALGLTKITFKDYFFGTLFGVIPGTFAYVYLGDSLASLNLIQITFAIVLLAVLSAGAGKLTKKKMVK